MSDIFWGVNAIFPITVVAAITLFLCKEALEAWKKRSEKRRKISVYKMLISDELLKNAWSIKSMRFILEQIEQDDFTSAEYEKDSSGTDFIKFNGGELFLGLAEVHSSVFQKVIVDLAVIDKGVFDEVKAVYESIAEIDHFRANIINMSSDSKISHFIKTFPSYAGVKLDGFEMELDALYKKFTGKDRSGDKLRSYI